MKNIELQCQGEGMLKQALTCARFYLRQKELGDAPDGKHHNMRSAMLLGELNGNYVPPTFAVYETKTKIVVRELKKGESH